MNRRKLLALAGLVALAVLAGCATGSTEIPEDELTGDATYDWETNATVAFNLSRSTYTTVIDVAGNSSIDVFTRDALGSETAVEVSALQFRFRNGTTVNATHANLSASRSADSTTLQLPAEEGKVAYTARRSGKQFGSPVFVPGSYSITLPPGGRVGIPVLSQAGPGGYATSVSNNRMTVRWPELEGRSISVRYYLQRDLLLFTGLLVFVIVVGAGGTLYYLRQIRRLENRREEMGIDIDYEDDDLGNDGPPPGM